METITLTKKEYDKLLYKALRFDYLKDILDDNFFSPPPTRKASEVIKAFKKTKKYNDKFLSSLENGLKRSKYFNK
jgi:hypothetical protein